MVKQPRRCGETEMAVGGDAHSRVRQNSSRGVSARIESRQVAALSKGNTLEETCRLKSGHQHPEDVTADGECSQRKGDADEE